RRQLGCAAIPELRAGTFGDLKDLLTISRRTLAMALVLALAVALFLVEDPMPRRKPRASTDPAADALLKTLHPHAAGCDIGADEIWVCFPPGAPLPPPPPGHPDGLPAHVRCFRTFTADLERLA